MFIVDIRNNNLTLLFFWAGGRGGGNLSLAFAFRVAIVMSDRQCGSKLELSHHFHRIPCPGSTYVSGVAPLVSDSILCTPNNSGATDQKPACPPNPGFKQGLFTTIMSRFPYRLEKSNLLVARLIQITGRAIYPSHGHDDTSGFCGRSSGAPRHRGLLSSAARDPTHM